MLTTQQKAVHRMLEKAEDRYGTNHPISEALRRQAERLKKQNHRVNPELTD
ncbi:hypothetical protein GH975_01735 [Litorivicinus lipolyticus]|jgi:hypothetical protein|uniref:Uncharacterized protein n=1 Tax=Litorivicinus lipolyticus TaxID=418701 RepID=A0A5Q2QAP2_9GAMM|nr:hypothetical protein [Litorivicinus lipolyticus]QGG79351.1 hypothetical protein GH975_01735 [Litorivicinus lipolyticus]